MVTGPEFWMWTCKWIVVNWVSNRLLHCKPPSSHQIHRPWFSLHRNPSPVSPATCRRDLSPSRLTLRGGNLVCFLLVCSKAWTEKCLRFRASCLWRFASTACHPAQIVECWESSCICIYVKIQSTFRNSLEKSHMKSTSANVSLLQIPTRTHKPLPISEISWPSTMTFAHETRWITAFIICRWIWSKLNRQNVNIRLV